MKTPVVRLAALLAIWGGLTVALGLTGALHHVVPGITQAAALALSIGMSVGFARIDWMRAAIAAVPLRGLIAFHTTRFVGAYLLWLPRAGRLPGEFAPRAGGGGIAAAVGACAVLLIPAGAMFRRAALLWNIFGIADLVVAVGTAGWLANTRLGSMREIVEFPLVLIPLFAVPLLMATHIVIFRRLAAASRDAEPLGRALSA